MIRVKLSFAAAALTLALPLPALAGDRDDAAQHTESARNLYFLLIGQARKDGRPRAALAYLNDFDQKFPGNVESAILRVNCLLDLDQVDQAQETLAQIPDKDRSPGTQIIRGHVASAQNAWDQAISYYQQALQVQPVDPLTSNALGYAYLRSGRNGLAVESLKRAADLSPSNGVIRNNLILALTVSGRMDEAESRQAAILDPNQRRSLRAQIMAEAIRLTKLAPTPDAAPQLAQQGAQ